jgi:hypothetical protein
MFPLLLFLRRGRIGLFGYLKHTRMKKIINSGLLSIILIVMFSGCTSSQIAAQTTPAGTITYQTFYNALSPYGEWIDYPGYGHVWNPRADGDFRPYATNGNWAYSTDGWAWESNYSWGWAPFHYGSWLYDDMYGWLWVPGYDWSPAWVTWGFADNYYCWAPIMPGVQIDLQFGSWRPNAFYWNVCDRAHIYDRNPGSEIAGRDHINDIAGRITIINNFNSTRLHNYYAKGPDLGEVEKYTNKRINPVTFKDVRQISGIRHQGNVMNIYRPSVQNPQPHEFRRADVGHINPIQNDGQHPSMGRIEQRNNIESLPAHRGGLPAFNRSSGSGQGRGGRHG